MMIIIIIIGAHQVSILNAIFFFPDESRPKNMESLALFCQENLFVSNFYT